MLVKRIITATILIAVVMAIIFYIPASWPRAFLIITAILGLFAAWEWSKLAGLETTPPRLLYILLMSAAFYNLMAVKVYFILLPAAAWWSLALILVVAYPNLADLWRGVLQRCAIGFLVIVPCWLAINLLRYQPLGQYMLLYLLVLVWGADTSAYFVGRSWGRRALAETVSPGKTIEGAAGAMIFTMILAVATAWLCDLPLGIWLWVVLLSVVTAIFSIVGDLFESAMKREANVKDSGNLLPGHGGFLDRIDSLTAAAPIFVLCVLILGRYIQ